MSQIHGERVQLPPAPSELPRLEQGPSRKRKTLIDLILWGVIGLALIAIAFVVFSLIGRDEPSVEIRSVGYVPTIETGGVTYSFEDQDIVELQLDFTFDENWTADLDPTSDDYPSQLFDRLVPGARFFHGDEEVELTFGYWPQEADANSAQEMSLFYVVPSGSAETLRFTFDGSVLGEGVAGLDTTVSPDEKDITG